MRAKHAERRIGIRRAFIKPPAGAYTSRRLPNLEHFDEHRLSSDGTIRGQGCHSGRAGMQDYFSHLSTNKLIQKLSLGEIPIPLVRIEASQKCSKGIYLVDLANYLDARIAAAKKELTAMTR